MGYDFGVGREAPTFTLTAADGSEISLTQYRGDWFPVVVFVPALAAGTPELLGQLSKAADTFWGLRGQLVGICDAGSDELGELAAQVPDLSFPLLADDGEVALAYGARRQAQGGAVRHMAFIIDRAGKIVWMGEGEGSLKASKLLAAFRDVVR